MHVLLQWDDEGNYRERALPLHDAFGFTLLNPVARMGQTVFKSVGVAMQDWVIAERLARHVKRELRCRA